jgi:aspartyl-tRNA(Asn)/glutamyl-tRNA(Gln) amidotransferase subunit C
MKLDKSLIKHVAEVARLNLTEQEIKEFLPQLKEILDAFSKIQEVDTDNVKPSYHAVEMKNALREDKPKKCLDNETALKNTEHKKEGYFKGPKVI